METIVRFGPGQRLAGVLTGTPSPSPQARPLLLLPSAGLQPRCGPFRLHVELGQRLARHGIRSFRFDLPGVGEAPRLNGCDGRAAALAAIDRLQALEGCTNFAIGGICSAADIGWQAAVADARVSALLLLDGICFSGPWFHYARAVNRMRRLPREWRRMWRSAPSRLRDGNGLDSADFREWPSRPDARRQFAQLVARDVRMLCIYSGGYTDRFMHARQFAWTFGAPARSPHVAMRYWPDCDHTYFARAHRDRLLAAVEDWMIHLPMHPGERP